MKMYSTVMLYLTVGYSMLVSMTTAMATVAVKNDPRILVLGGNGFMGADTVELLLNSSYNVTIVNRGSAYWDVKDRIFSRVQSISCDRVSGLQKCQPFRELLESREETFVAVIDFSAYHPGQVKDSTEMLKRKTDLYILISTDSVYDVCVMKTDGLPYKETDSVRPADEKDREFYKQYSYGHNKLTGEEELLQSGLSHVILRLPDVIGPRDTTHRWWLYQVWTKLSAKLPQYSIGYPDSLEAYDMSLVYSPDVARVILQLVKDVGEAKDQVFNLAWPELFTLKNVLESMRDELGLEGNVTVRSWNADERSFYMYPSGRRGPVDVEKVVKVLQWSPTSWRQAVKETVSFYEDAMTLEKYRTQVDEIVQHMENQGIIGGDKTVLYKTIEEVYNISLKHFVSHDEL